MKSAGLGPRYAAQWDDPEMASAYVCRPPYSRRLIKRVLGLRVGDGPVLDVGAGTGDIARPMASVGVDVDAVEPSAAMIGVGRSLPFGDRVRWVHGRAEDVTLGSEYAICVAGESVHWLELDRALPRVRDAIAAGGVFAVAVREDGLAQGCPALKEIVREYSTNKDYVPYDSVTVIKEAGWFNEIESWQDDPEDVSMTVTEYVRSMHSRNGLGAESLGWDALTRFDAAASEAVSRVAVDGRVTVRSRNRLHWGVIHGRST